MKKNIFLKSLLRQPLKSLLLIVLIGLASFGFVLRAVEYTVVRSQINAIARFYRTVGLIHAQNPFADAAAAVELLENSRFVDFVEYRPSVQGILADMRNTDIYGSYSWMPEAMRPSRNDFFFYGTLLDIQMTADGAVLSFGINPEDMVVGHPEFMLVSQAWSWSGQPNVTLLLPDARSLSAFEGMQPMGRYFIRGYQYISYDMGWPVRPSIGWSNDGQIIRALNHEMPDQEPVFFIHTTHGGIDLTAHGLQHLYDVMRDVERSQHSVTLRTTSDMLILPFARGTRPPVRIMRGRHICKEDYINARPVAIINIHMAMQRRLDVGDTLRVAVPEVQNFSIIGNFGYPDLLLAGDAHAPEEMLDLEIIGVFQYTIPGVGSRAGLTVYIPTSVLPDNLTILPPVNPTGQMAGWDENHMPAGWVSFTLADSRQEQAFELQYTDMLYEMGFRLALIHAYADSFWASATMILMTVTFNSVVFSVALVLVIGLVIFLYLRGSHRNFAISRATGSSRGRLVLRFCLSGAALAIPAILAGAIPAWIYGQEVARQTLSPVMEIATGINVDMALEPEWFGIFAAIVLTLVLVFSLFGSIKLLTVPVLLLLQGKTSKPRTAKAKKSINTFAPTAVAQATRFEDIRVSASKLPTAFGAKMGGNFHWLGKHIFRQPSKTFLGIAIALFFVVGVGWLQENIERTGSQVDYLYDTTVVHVDFSGGMRPPMVRLMDDLSYIENIYLETLHTLSFVMPRGDEEVFPANWAEIIGYDTTLAARYNFHVLDILYGFNRFDSFARLHTRGFDDGFTKDIEVVFGDGFGQELFETTHDERREVTPVVLYEGLMEHWGLEIGDPIWLAYTLLGMIRLSGSPAIVAGVHNGGIFFEGLEESVLIPLAYKERHLSWAMGYSNMSFTIDTRYNRIIAEIRQELLYISGLGEGFGWGAMHMLDQELSNVVAAMEQSLLFLEMLYPLAVALSIIIGLGLSLLLMMQNTKNAAIMRVIGITGGKVRGILFTEQMLVCTVGAMAGLAALVFMGWGFGLYDIVVFVVAYIVGAAVGSAIGSIIVTGKPPLDLLQTRE